jgi:molybdopterin-containing oxidoreductase family iron-sulfur binding subunit
MVIDLDECTACGACVVACQAENNVPPADSEDRKKGKSIQWMDILPFVEGEYPFVKMRLLPRPCMHCENPPCIRVCPVRATYINEEGLVGQIYPRCIGCRYCTTACPYTVRYFNWKEPHWPGKMRNSLNPDVSVRTKGVVEKCSFCHHRLLRAREKAKMEKRKLREEEYVPACVQTCPSGAMHFGDLEDPESNVSRLARSLRAFKLMEDLGTEPKVIYLAEGR